MIRLPRDRRATRRAFAMLAAGWLPISAAAQVVFDGSLGPTGSLSGDMVIGEQHGTRVGENLFHSFQVFNVLTGERATFTSDFSGATNHVIARVTGGAGSLINGPLVNAIPGADLWLINPAGVTFGAGASIDVQGSFHASTADYLLLDDGGRFAADLASATGTVLTMGNPAAFGFLGPAPAPMAVTGASLAVPAGEALTLVGGDVELSDATLSAPGGRIDVAAFAGAGEAFIAPRGLSWDGEAQLGDVTLDGAEINADATGGGDIYLRGGRFVMENGARVSARSQDNDGGVIDVAVASLEMTDESHIDGGTEGDGRGADISVLADGEIVVADGSQISSDTQDNGDGGDVTIRAGSRLLVTGASAAGDPSAVGSRASRFGDAGNLFVEAPTVTLVGGGRLTTESIFFGDAGNIEIRAVEELTASGFTRTGHQSGVWVSNFSRGGAGDLLIDAGDVTIRDGATIMGEAGRRGSGGRNGGDGANVTIRATGDVVLDHNNTRNAFYPTGILVSTWAGGDGGTIDISARNISLLDGAFLFAGALNGGNAGQIYLSAAGEVRMETSAELAETTTAISVEGFGGEGDGGVIRIDAENFTMLGASEVILRSGERSSGSAAELIIDVRDTITQHGENDSARANVFAEARGANSSSANISYNARAIDLAFAGIINSARFTGGSAGSISLTAANSILLDNTTVGSAGEVTTERGADLFVTTGLLSLTGYSSILTNTFDRSPGAGNITVRVDELRIVDSVIEAEACSCGAGDAGSIDVVVTGNVYLSGADVFGAGGGIRSRTFGAGRGGTIRLVASGLFISDGAGILASSSATVQDFIDQGFPGEVPGQAGNIFVDVDRLVITEGGAIGSTAVEAAGGNIDLSVADSIFLDNGFITAEALGVTPEDSGGNVMIAAPATIVLQNSAIRANANAGNGGNINITAEALVPSALSLIDASSQTGIDGQVVIDSPNQAVSSVALLDAPVFDVAGLVEDPCEVDVLDRRSSLTIEGQGGLPAAPDEFLPAPETDPVTDEQSAAHPAKPAMALAAHGLACEDAGP